MNCSLAQVLSAAQNRGARARRAHWESGHRGDRRRRVEGGRAGGLPRVAQCGGQVDSARGPRVERRPPALRRPAARRQLVRARGPLARPRGRAAQERPLARLAHHRLLARLYCVALPWSAHHEW